MYKKFKKYLFIMLALILTMSDAGLIKAQASNSWSTREIMKQKEQSRIKYRKTMDKKVAIFSKQNSDRSIYSTLSNVENDISGAFKNTYNFYEQNYVIRQKSNLNRYNTLLDKINSYDINDTSYDNVKNIYETSVQFWQFLPDDEYGNIKRNFPVSDFFFPFSFPDAYEPFINGLKDSSNKSVYIRGKYIDYSKDNIIKVNKMNVQMGIDGYNGLIEIDKDQISYGSAGLAIITSANLNYVNKAFSKYESESTKSADNFSKLAKVSSDKLIDSSKMASEVEGVIDDLNYFKDHSGNSLEYSNGKWITDIDYGSHENQNKLIDNDKETLRKLDAILTYMRVHKHETADKKVTVKKSNKKPVNKAKKKYVKNSTQKKKAVKKVIKKRAKKAAAKKNHKKSLNKTKKKYVKKNKQRNTVAKKIIKKRAKKAAAKKNHKKSLNKTKKKYVKKNKQRNTVAKKIIKKRAKKAAAKKNNKKPSNKTKKKYVKKSANKKIAKKKYTKKHANKKAHPKKSEKVK
ncbi:hypothetical protein MUB42_02870 [Apilactobacillus kunkeei]|nr:hypothetical protein MUB42_02870 [Apilactobacillus kunkeei]